MPSSRFSRCAASSNRDAWASQGFVSCSRVSVVVDMRVLFLSVTGTSNREEQNSHVHHHAHSGAGNKPLGSPSITIRRSSTTAESRRRHLESSPLRSEERRVGKKWRSRV